jgi:phosphosulfolactate phosphohydrolase-like enzyme
MKLSLEQIREFARATMATRPEEIDCDTWLIKVAAFLDVLRDESTIPPDLEIVSQHVEVCADCRDELSAMLDALGGES